MAHQQVGAALARGGDRGAQGLERFEAEPVHAGVEVQRRRRRPALRARERGPAFELRRAADRRREAEGGVVGERVGLRLQPVEHIDARVGLRQQRAQPLALADLGDEEGAAAGGVERRRDRLDPEAVAVRLDHGGAIARRGAARQQPPIVGERGDVDRQDRRRGGGFAHAHGLRALDHDRFARPARFC